MISCSATPPDLMACTNDGPGKPDSVSTVFRAYTTMLSGRLANVADMNVTPLHDPSTWPMYAPVLLSPLALCDSSRITMLFFARFASALHLGERLAKVRILPLPLLVSVCSWVQSKPLLNCEYVARASEYGLPRSSLPMLVMVSSGP